MAVLDRSMRVAQRTCMNGISPVIDEMEVDKSRVIRREVLGTSTRPRGNFEPLIGATNVRCIGYEGTIRSVEIIAPPSLGKSNWHGPLMAEVATEYSIGVPSPRVVASVMACMDQVRMRVAEYVGEELLIAVRHCFTVVPLALGEVGMGRSMKRAIWRPCSTPLGSDRLRLVVALVANLRAPDTTSIIITSLVTDASGTLTAEPITHRACVTIATRTCASVGRAMVHPAVSPCCIVSMANGNVRGSVPSVRVPFQVSPDPLDALVAATSEELLRVHVHTPYLLLVVGGHPAQSLLARLSSRMVVVLVGGQSVQRRSIGPPFPLSQWLLSSRGLYHMDESNAERLLASRGKGLPHMVVGSVEETAPRPVERMATNGIIESPSSEFCNSYWTDMGWIDMSRTYLILSPLMLAPGVGATVRSWSTSLWCTGVGISVAVALGSTTACTVPRCISSLLSFLI